MTFDFEDVSIYASCPMLMRFIRRIGLERQPEHASLEDFEELVTQSMGDAVKRYARAVMAEEEDPVALASASLLEAVLERIRQRTRRTERNPYQKYLNETFLSGRLLTLRMNLGRLPFTRETLVDIDVEEEVECGAHRYKGKADLVYRSEGKLMAVLFEWKRNDMTGRPRSMPWTMAYWGAERAVEKRYEQRVSGTMRIDLVTGRDKFCARQSDNMDHRLRQEIAIIGECIERGWLPSMPTTAKCKSCLFEDLCLRYRY